MPNGLYYVTNLQPLTPYTLTFTNTAEDASPYWRDLGTASFVTASLGGVVRTVPGSFEDYTPIAMGRPEPAPTYETDRADYVIAGATVFEGTRDGKRRIADVAISGERIVAVGDLAALPRGTTIDGRGKYVTPGFIDIHSHADENVLEVADAPSHIRQGITTVLGGNCSFLGVGDRCVSRRCGQTRDAGESVPTDRQSPGAEAGAWRAQGAADV